jgi:hypothetical protein
MCGQVEEKVKIGEGNVCLWGFALHLSGGQQNVILWRMRGKRGLCLQICCVGMMGLSLGEDSLGAWFTVGPRPKSQRATVFGCWVSKC